MSMLSCRHAQAVSLTLDEGIQDGGLIARLSGTVALKNASNVLAASAGIESQSNTNPSIRSHYVERATSLVPFFEASRQDDQSTIR
jgi:hypothetical protein